MVGIVLGMVLSVVSHGERAVYVGAIPGGARRAGKSTDRTRRRGIVKKITFPWTPVLRSKDRLPRARKKADGGV